MQQVLPFISTLFILISAVLIAVGWRFIKLKKRDAHEKIMLTAAFFALAFFVIYISRTVFLGNVSFGGPDDVKVYYTIFLIFHIVLATVGGIFGLVTIILAYRKNFFKHKKIGPVTSVIWFFTAATGVIVYLLLYVIYPNGETTSLIKAILGN